MNIDLDHQRKAEKSILKRMGQIGGNIASVFASDVMNRASTFLVYAMVGRYLGTLEFGQLSLALTFFQTFQLFAIAGLQTLIMREVSKKKDETSRYIFNGGVIVLVFSVLSLLALGGLTTALNYSPDTTLVILTLSLSLIPYALGVITDAIFQAWERMHYIASGNLVANLIKVGLSFLLLTQGYQLSHIVAVIFLSHVVNLIVKWYWLTKHIIKPTFSFEPPFAWSLVKATTTFLAIRSSKAILNSLDVIILSKMAGEIEVGLFAAAFQIMVPIGLVFESTVTAVFPIMCKNYDGTFQRMKVIAEQLLELLLAIVIPTSIGIFFFSDTALSLLYGNEEFGQSATILRIVVWVLILRVFTQVMGSSLVASMQEKKTLRIFLVNVVATVIFAPIFIIQFGLYGAAFGALAIRIVDFIQHYIPVSRMFAGFNIFKLVWKPIIGGLVMTGFLNYMKDQNLFLTILSAGIIYAAVLVIVALWNAGGIEQLKLSYLSPWTDKSRA